MAESIGPGAFERLVDDRRSLIGIAAGVVATALVMTAGFALFTGGDESQATASQSDGGTVDAPDPQAASLGDGSSADDEEALATDLLETESTATHSTEQTNTENATPTAETGAATETTVRTTTTSAVDATASANTGSADATAPTSAAAPTSTTAPTTTTAPRTTATPRTTTRPQTTAPPNNSSPIASLERQWAANRQVVIDRIRAGNYGVGADNVLRGPGGLRVDLNACPSDWSDHEGLGRGTFTIGYTSAQSGYLQAYGQVGEGMSSYFDYVNSTGGIQGQRIELQMRDDGYVADRTIDEVESWLASRTQPFAITTLGTPNGLAVQRMLNDACVPHPFALSAHQALTNPAEYPFTNGLQMSHATEARIWGEWIRRNMADQLPVKVGALIMDNDFGLTYERAFSTWVRDNPDVVSDFHRVRHNPAAPTVTPEMNTIIAGEPDVFISMTTGSPCLLAVQEAGHKGLTASAVAFTPSVCRSEASYMAPAGEVADGFLSAQGGILGPNDPGVDEQFARFVNSTLRADGLNINDLTEQGFGLHGWTYVEALRIAAELEGGMSRTNLLLAMWSLDLHHPLADDGARLRTNGPSDSFAIEGSRIDRWDAASQQWKPATGVIDINGKTPSCTWVTGVGC